IDNVIALLLCIVQTEVLPGKLNVRVHLETQVASVDGIEKIETDGKILSESCLHRFTEQLSTFGVDQVDRRHLEDLTVDLQQQAVLLRHAVETPAIIRHRTVETTNLLHPLS